MYIRNKSIPMVIILSIVTCGIYYYIWIYQTSQELNNTLGESDNSPGLEVLLCIVTCGIYGVYWFYKYSQKINALSSRMNVPVSDNTTLYLVLLIANYFTGMLIFVAEGIMQSQINQLADSRPDGGTPNAGGPNYYPPNPPAGNANYAAPNAPANPLPAAQQEPAPAAPQEPAAPAAPQDAAPAAPAPEAPAQAPADPEKPEA